MPDMNMNEQRLLWFSAGFALATVLSIGVTLRGHPKAANEGHLKTGQR